MTTLYVIGKSQSLENALSNLEGVSIQYLHINESKMYSENIAKFFDIVSNRNERDIGIIGIGLGGFYATRLAERLGIRSVLIDTVVDAYREVEWDDERIGESYYPALITTVTLKPLIIQTYKNPSVERFYATDAKYFDGDFQRLAKTIVEFTRSKFTFNELFYNAVSK